MGNDQALFTVVTADIFKITAVTRLLPLFLLIFSKDQSKSWFHLQKHTNPLSFPFFLLNLFEEALLECGGPLSMLLEGEITPKLRNQSEISFSGDLYPPDQSFMFLSCNVLRIVICDIWLICCLRVTTCYFIVIKLLLSLSFNNCFYMWTNKWLC